MWWWLLLGYSVFLPASYGTISACDKANGAEVLGCALDGQIATCAQSISKRNKTWEPLCDFSPDAQALSVGNKNKFDVFIVGYEYTYPNIDSYILLGANVSLVTSSKGTSAFVISIHVPLTNYTRCRFINVTKFRSFQHSLMLWYDCMYLEAGEIGFTLTVTELPTGVQRRQSCLANNTNLNPVTITEWRSLICIEQYDVKFDVLVWFQAAPPSFGNFSYNVSLLKEDRVVKNYTVFNTGTLKSAIKFEKLVNLNSGNYRVGVTSLHPNCRGRCPTTKSTPFVVPVTVLGEWPINKYLIACGIVMLIFIISVASVVLFCRKKPRNDAKVYLVYVWDKESHFNLVKQFALLLKSCGFSVLFDEWEVQGCNPITWTRQCVAKADFVIIVWSRAAVRRYTDTLTESDERIEPKYKTSHMFRTILNYVLERIHNSCNVDNQHRPNSVCNLFWDSGVKLLIPAEFKYTTPFVMPKKFQKLLRYLRQDPIPHDMPCDPCLPRENFHKRVEYRTFLEFLQIYKSDLGVAQECSGQVNDLESRSSDNVYSPLLINLNDETVLEAQPQNMSLTDHGYVSLPIEDANPTIQTLDASLPLGENEQRVRSEEPSHFNDDSASLRDLYIINTLLET